MPPVFSRSALLAILIAMTCATAAQGQQTSPPLSVDEQLSPTERLRLPLIWPKGYQPGQTNPTRPTRTAPLQPSPPIKANPPVQTPESPIIYNAPKAQFIPEVPKPKILPPPTFRSTNVPVRGLWVDAFGPGLKTRIQVKRMVAEAKEMGFNTLFVQAVRRSDCLCMKSGLPLVTDKDLEKDFDPLMIAAREAKARGMRIIAWTSLTGMASTQAPNRNPKHIFKKHGPKSGKNSWVNRRSNGTYKESGDIWIDPAIPAAADFMVESTVNLIKNYPIDGIQLDRIRYPDNGAWGYDAKSIARFNAETGSKGRPKASNPAWQQWKRDQVTALVRRIALEVKTIKPKAWISAATIVYGNAPKPGDHQAFKKTRTYTETLQDWPLWIREGLVDLNVPMNYRYSPSITAVVTQNSKPTAQAQFDGWTKFAASMRVRADGRTAPLAIGTAMYLNTPQVTLNQAQRSTQQGLGWVGYSYRTPTRSVYRNQQQAHQGFLQIGTLLSQKGAPLANTQKWTATPPSHRGIMGRLVGPKFPGNHKVEAWRDGRLIGKSTTDGNGYFGFLTLVPGKVEIRVAEQRWTGQVPELGIERLPDLLKK